MAFGQSSGPPATAKQMDELTTLLRAAGHRDFRDARGPMGFSQRQAAGKFTRDEAAAFIEGLEGSEAGGSPAEAPSALAHLSAEMLAVELRGRGWMVIEPLEGTDSGP